MDGYEVAVPRKKGGLYVLASASRSNPLFSFLLTHRAMYRIHVNEMNPLEILEQAVRPADTELGPRRDETELCINISSFLLVLERAPVLVCG